MAEWKAITQRMQSLMRSDATVRVFALDGGLTVEATAMIEEALRAASPQAHSGQQAEPTDEQIDEALSWAVDVDRSLPDWEIRQRRADARAVLALAGQQSERPAPDAYNRRLRAQLEQEWADVRRLKAAYGVAEPAGQAVGERIDAALAMFPVCFDGQSFRINDGPPLTADGDDVFYSKKKVLALLESLYGHLKGIEAALAASQAERPAVKEAK